MNNKLVSLHHFWPDGYVGHTDPSGIDIGKLFLINLFSSIYNDPGKRVEVHSHFFERGLIDKVKDLTLRLTSLTKGSNLNKRRALYGYGNNTYQLNSDNSNIWYTSENMRPPLDVDFDVFLSHDLDSYDGRNVYLPIWVTRLGHDLYEVEKKIHSLTHSRSEIGNGRNGICAVISNPEPIRMAFINELQKHIEVDIYGALGMPIHNKMQTLMKYKMNICFENDEFPGYVTEKPFEASESGCIPIWRGLDKDKYLNPEAIIDVTKLGFASAIEQILNIMQNDDVYNHIASQPILARAYDVENLRRTIISLLSRRNRKPVL